jgi:hypothetical protein
VTARTFTPDRKEINDEGRTVTHITTKRVCNGCGEFVGDVTEQEFNCAINGRPLPDVRSECKHCAPVVEAEQVGCQTWQVTPHSIRAVDDAIDTYNVFAKGFWQEVDGKLTVVGLRVGTGNDRVVAFWGDWLIRHPDGRFTVHTAPKSGEEAEARLCDCPPEREQADYNTPANYSHAAGCNAIGDGA